LALAVPASRVRANAITLILICIVGFLRFFVSLSF
jgi:hypothetical protein